MALREIITVGDPRLRTRSRPVEKVTPELRELIRDMIETMDAANGVGLAAVQVGVPLRVVVIETPEDEDDPNSGKLFVVLNPEIVKTGKETEIGTEGCLSVPGYAGEVERATEIVVRGLDRHGKPFRFRPRGFLARVFQHEIDHCNGILYTDRLVAPDRIWEVKPGEEEQTEAEDARRRAATVAE
ncbi:MAG TPA: peptide deformylase [Anaerolineae bacterium]|nr:peptide deformylase [Anaerolineae bacterium]HQK14591.1 peptide deformylase [Anaerolineae bacterium]